MGVFGEAGEDFNLWSQESFLVSLHIVPGRNLLGASCKLSTSRNDPHFLLPRDYLFSQLVPSLVELAFVFVSPFLGNVMRRMARACSKVDIEWSIGGK